MKHYPIPEISEVLNVRITTIEAWSLRKRWPMKRAKLDERRLLATFKNQDKSLKGVVATAIDIIKNGLISFKAREKQLDTKDLKLLSDLLANFDRIVRLDEGKPTDHVLHEYERSGVDMILAKYKQEVQMLINEDPLAIDMVVDAEYVELNGQTGIHSEPDSSEEAERTSS